MPQNGERPLRSDEQAFLHGLYQKHYRALYDYTYQLGVGRDVAEDFVQDAFMVAIRRIETIKKYENPRGYLYQVLKNVIGYRLRSLRYAISLQKKLQEDHGDVQNEPYTEELPPETLYGGAIGEAELKLLIRFYLEGWSQKELAEEMGVSGNACQKRITRAKLHLRKALEETGPPGTEDPLPPDSMTKERRRERP